MAKLTKKDIQDIYIRKALGESVLAISDDYEVSHQAISWKLKTYTPQLQYVVYGWYKHIGPQDWKNKWIWMIKKIHCSRSKETLNMEMERQFEAFDEFFSKNHLWYIGHKMDEYTELFYDKECDTYTIREWEEEDFYIYF